MRRKNCVLLPAAGKRMQYFHLMFTKPGRSLLAEPCRCTPVFPPMSPPPDCDSPPPQPMDTRFTWGYVLRAWMPSQMNDMIHIHSLAGQKNVSNLNPHLLQNILWHCLNTSPHAHTRNPADKLHEKLKWNSISLTLSFQQGITNLVFSLWSLLHSNF